MADVDPFKEVTVGEDRELGRDEREKFAPRQNETYRVSMAWWREVKTPDGRTIFGMDTEQPRLLVAKVLYREGVGFALYKGEEYRKLLGVEVSERIGTVLVSWPVFHTGPDAGVTAPDLFKAGRFEVLPWFFSKSKYQQILRAHNTKPLGSGDLRITCTNAKYQHLEIGSYTESYLGLIMGKQPELFETIRARINKVAGAMRKRMGTDYTLEGLREKLGIQESGGGSSVQEVVPSGEDFDNLLDGLMEE